MAVRARSGGLVALLALGRATAGNCAPQRAAAASADVYLSTPLFQQHFAAFSSATGLKLETNSRHTAFKVTGDSRDANKQGADTAGSSLKMETSSSHTGFNVRGETTGDKQSADKIVVIGGNGFVGSHVCKEAMARGIDVTSINRSGPPKEHAAWVHKVNWVQSDVFDTESWKPELQGAKAVVSCLGAFGSNDFMERINGDANVSAVETAASAGVPRFVYVSAHNFQIPGPLLRGYFEGKRKAEAAILTFYPETGVILRPGMIYGPRNVGPVTIPLQLIGAPLEVAMSLGPIKAMHERVPFVGQLLVPPIDVKAVVKACVRGATDDTVPGGILDVEQIKEVAEGF
eukprot:jgi/Chlat1/4296/Chrsp29S04556